MNPIDQAIAAVTALKSDLAKRFAPNSLPCAEASDALKSLENISAWLTLTTPAPKPSAHLNP